MGKHMLEMMVGNVEEATFQAKSNADVQERRLQLLEAEIKTTLGQMRDVTIEYLRIRKVLDAEDSANKIQEALGDAGTLLVATSMMRLNSTIGGWAATFGLGEDGEDV